MQLAYLDESISEKAFVLGGHVASPMQWRKFSSDWGKLLERFGVLGQDNRYRFKMSEMAQLDERMERLAPFVHVMKSCIPFSISCGFSFSDYNNAKSSLVVVGADMGKVRFNPYEINLKTLLVAFGEQIDNYLLTVGVGERVRFTFDHRPEEKRIVKDWAKWIERFPNSRRYSDPPKFEDDNECLPLQAADFWAWWVRMGYEEAGDMMAYVRNFPDFGLHRAAYRLEEENFRIGMAAMVRQQFPGVVIYDRRSGLEIPPGIVMPRKIENGFYGLPGDEVVAPAEMIRRAREARVR